MAKIDIEKYKTAWKNEQVFDEGKLSEKQVEAFMRSASKNILALFKRSLVIDIVLKAALLALFIPLIFLMPYSGSWVSISLFLGLIQVAGIAWQAHIIRKIPSTGPDVQNVSGLLRAYITFYYKYYYPSIFVGALSGALVFLTGSLYYFYFKYQEIPKPEIDDMLVLGMGLFLAFALSVAAQVVQGNFHMRQLESRVQEIEADTLTERSIEKYQNQRARNILMISIALLAGVLLLLYFICHLLQ